MLALPTEELARQSEVIAVAEVQSLQTIRSGGRLTTRVTLGVISPVKGTESGATLEVNVPGGTEGEWAQRVEGAPVLTEGDRCVVFLEPAGGRMYHFTGLEQGKLALERDTTAPGGWIVRRHQTADLVERSPAGHLVPAPPPPETEPLGAYLDELHEIVEHNR